MTDKQFNAIKNALIFLLEKKPEVKCTCIYHTAYKGDKPYKAALCQKCSIIDELKEVARNV